MRISVHSDLHLEFTNHRKRWSDVISSVIDNDIQVVCLLGDIWKDANQACDFLLDFYAVCEADILFVVGNHELYYDSSIADYKQLEHIFSKFKVLDKRTVEINGVNFIGATLWATLSPIEGWSQTDIKYLIYRGIADFRKIPSWSISRMVSEGNQDIRYIQSTLKKHKKKGLKSVVLTHFSPLRKWPHSRYGLNALTAYFCNDYEKIIEDHKPYGWFFGHTHDNICGFVGSTMLGTNQAGYGQECHMSYDLNYFIDIG